MSAASRAIPPDRVEHDRDRGHRRSVEDRRRYGVHATSKTLREYGGRKGDERDEHQEDHVDHRERAVRTPDQGEEAMMLDPHDPDREEADQIANELGPLAEKGRSEVLPRVWQPDGEHE